MTMSEELNSDWELWFRRIFYIILVIWLSYMLLQTREWNLFEDYFFPLLVGVPGLLLLILLFSVEEIKQNGLQDTDDNQDKLVQEISDEERSSLEPRKGLAAVGWVLAFPIVLYLFGLVWGLPMFLLIFSYYLLRDVKKSVGLTVIIVVFIYGLFFEMLNVLVWEGIFDLPNILN